MEQYTVVEGQPLATSIRMMFTKTQNNFSMTLNPLSIEDAENMFTVRNFINLSSTEQEATETSGKVTLL